MYTQISSTISTLQSPPLIIGDFNEILELEEWTGQERVTKGMHESENSSIITPSLIYPSKVKNLLEEGVIQEANR